MSDNNINPAFTDMATWYDILPEGDQRGPQHILRLARDGRGPKCFRFGGSQRSEPYFSKADVLAWFRLWYGVLRPELVATLISWGWDKYTAPPVGDFRRPKTRGIKPGRKKPVSLRQKRSTCSGQVQ